MTNTVTYPKNIHFEAPDAWATHGAYVYILRLLHILGFDTGNHLSCL